MENRCQQEIVELHQFFQDWFTGVLLADDAAFARFSQVLGDTFIIISPDGRALSRNPLLESLRGMHGAHKGQRIWIENVQLRHQADNLALVTYEEWQEVAENKTGRLSTVLFQVKPDTPNGLEWLHVHETWLPAP